MLITYTTYHLRQLVAAIVAFVALCLPMAVASQTTDTKGIVDEINDTYGTTITVQQPSAMDARVNPNIAAPEKAEAEKDETDKAESESVGREKGKPRKIAGYRVQVFSDNNQRQAKGKAEQRRNAMRSRFPEHQAYVTFNSPYWRVKVGDFRTRGEADAAARSMKSAFPGYANDIRVVRDYILVY